MSDDTYPFGNEQCPVCGYYCLGKGGHGCIDKPSIMKIIESNMGLKKCPFCGGKAYIHEEDDIEFNYGVHIYCGNMDCLCDIGWHDTIKEAIKAWNTRYEGIENGMD